MTSRRRSVYRLIFSLGALLVTGTLQAQPDPTALLRLADAYYEHENYAASVTECLRFLHVAPEHSQIYYAYYRAGMAEAKLGNTTQSLRRLRAAAHHAPETTMQRRIKYRMAVTLLAAHQFDLAKLELFQLALTPGDTLLATHANILLGLAHLYQQDWEQARTTFHRAAALYPRQAAFQETIQAVEARLETLQRTPRRKSPKIAKWISTFVPGGGQIYAERYGDGVNALALNAGTTYLVQRSFANGSPRNAILLITGLWWRYYKGNRVRAAEAARIANADYQETILIDVYLLLRKAGSYLPPEPSIVERLAP